MKHICITGYNSFIGKNFYKKYKKKFKISPYKDNINNIMINRSIKVQLGVLMISIKRMIINSNF